MKGLVPLDLQILQEGVEPQTAYSLLALEQVIGEGGVVAVLTVAGALTKTLPFGRRGLATALALLRDSGVQGWEIDHSLDEQSPNTLSVYREGDLVARVSLEGNLDPLGEIVGAITKAVD